MPTDMLIAHILTHALTHMLTRVFTHMLTHALRCGEKYVYTCAYIHICSDAIAHALLHT